MTSFPTALDSFPAASDLTGNPLNAPDHPSAHEDLGTAIAALEAKVGIDGSDVTTSLDYLVANPSIPLTAIGPIAGNTMVGNNTASIAAPVEMSATDVLAFLGLGPISSPVAITDGGTGSTTAQAAIDALAGATSNHQVLAGNGTHVTLRSLAVADLPTGTGASSVPLGGVITAGGPQGDNSHTQVLTWNAAGQLTTVTNTAISSNAIGAFTLAGVSGGQTAIGGTATTDTLTFKATSNGSPATGADILFQSGSTQLAQFRKSGWIYVGPVTSGYPNYEGQAPGIEFNNNGTGAVYSENSGLGASFIGTEAAPSFGCTIDLRNSRTSVTAPTALQSGDYIGGMRVGSIGNGYGVDVAQITAKATELHSSSSTGTKWEFMTCANTTTTKVVALTIDQDFSSTILGNASILNGGTATYTTQPGTLLSLGATPTGTAQTYTLNFASAVMGSAINFSPTVEFQQTAGAFGMGVAFITSATWKNKTTVAANLKGLIGFQDAPSFRADGATITAGASTSFYSFPNYNVINSGVQSAGTHTAFQSSFIVGTGATVATRKGFHYDDSTVSGTLTDQFAIDIEALVNQSGKGVGIRCTPAIVYVPTVCACTSNAATVPVNVAHAKVTNSSAATCTITLTTSGALDGQELLVRFLDFSAVSQTVTFSGSETGKAGAPPVSLGSTTIPTTYRFIFNSGTTKWTYTGN